MMTLRLISDARTRGTYAYYNMIVFGTRAITTDHNLLVFIIYYLPPGMSIRLSNPIIISYQSYYLLVKCST